MTIIYRETDPVSGRWTGNSGGVDLNAFQIDQNFYECVSRIATLETNESFTVSIDFITITGNELTFHMTNHTLQGPFTIPVATFHDRGTWQPFTVYSVNDTFNINGTLYDVLFPHTSAATFSAGANDGLGHNYYSAMITVPGNSLPTGGATDQVLQKSSSADFAVTWGYKLPTGGSTGQILAKNSNTNQDVIWETFPGVSPPPPSPAGTSGEVLATVDGTHTNTEWIRVIYAPSTSGAAGQVPATASGSNAIMNWITVVSAPPPSPAGTAGQVLATIDGTHTNMGWITPAGSGGLSSLSDVSVTEGAGINGYSLYWNNSTTKWEAHAVLIAANNLSDLVTPATARTNLGLGTSSVDDVMTAAQYRNNTASKVLTTDTVWGAAATVTLTDAATVTMDFNTFINAKLTGTGGIGSSRTLAAATNVKVGQSGVIEWFPVTGALTLVIPTSSTYVASGGVSALSLSSTNGARDAIAYTVLNDGKVLLSVQKALST